MIMRNRFIFAMTALACYVLAANAEMTDISQYDNVIYAESISGTAGTSVVMSVKMKNSIPITGFQFDLQLPEGVSVAVDEGGFYVIELSTARTTLQKTNYFDNSLQSDGTIRIMASSTKNFTFSGNDGEVVIITLDVSGTLQDGNYPICLNNIVMSDTDSKTYQVAQVETMITIGETEQIYDEGYNISVIPFELNEDVSDIPFTVESAQALTNIEFDIILPKCIGDNELYDITKALGTTAATTSIDGEYGNIHVSIARKNSNTIASGTDVAKLEIGYDPVLLSLGIYPITVKNVVLTGIDGSDYHAAPTTSYIKVGNPINAQLSLVGHVTSDMNDALASETSIGTLDMSKVTSMDGTLVLVDGRSFIAPKKTVEVDKASYLRNVSSSWGTICLPFTVSSNDDVQFYQLSGVDITEGVMTFTPVQNVSAGIPAVFKLLNGTSLDVSSDNVEIISGNCMWNKSLSGAVWTMKGTFTAMTLDPLDTDLSGSSIYYISEDKFWYGNQSFAVPAYRGWFEAAMSSVSSAPIFFGIESNEETTGIDYVEDNNGNLIFDLTGRQQYNINKGINIINNKKVLVR